MDGAAFTQHVPVLKQSSRDGIQRLLTEKRDLLELEARAMLKAGDCLRYPNVSALVFYCLTVALLEGEGDPARGEESQS